jgi:peptidoglycan/LPS O-acetylase OafA/YrhL
MLDREERRQRFHGRYNAAIWIMLVAMGVMYALVAGWSRDQPTKVYFSIGITLMMLMFGGSVQLVAGFIGRARLEVVKDIKGLELRIIELESLLRDQNR